MLSHVLQIEEKKQAAADVLFQYPKIVMASLGNQVRPFDLRLHLMKVHELIHISILRHLQGRCVVYSMSWQEVLQYM